MKQLLLTVMMAAGITAMQAQVYLTEDFEGTGIPAGWGQNTLANDGGWNFGTNVQLQSQYFPIDPHTKMAATNDDDCNCNKSADRLYTASVDLSNASSQVFMTFESFFFNQTYQGSTEEARIQVSIDNGTTWTDVMVVPGNSGTSWESKSVDLSTYSGNPDVKVGFHYNDGGGWLYGWAIDDISIFSPMVGLDLAVTTVQVGKMDPTPTFVGFAKYLTGLPLEINVSVTNEASMPITSFDVSWTDGTNTNNQSVTGVNITSLQQHSFTMTVPYATLAGSQTVDVTVSNVNAGATELNTSNNTASQSVLGVDAHPDAMYVAEEGTGTWCGWCPRGDVFMHYMREQYPGQFVGVAVHNGDPMTVAAYDNGLGISAFPGVKVNRMATIDPADLETDFINRIVNAPPVVITGTAVLNSATSMLTVNLTGDFTQALSGDYRFAAVLREDSVQGVGSGFSQVNYYGNNAAGPMGGFENLPATVSYTMMYYDFVGRALMGGFPGQPGSLPATIASGSMHSYQFTFSVPSTFDFTQLSVAGLVLNAGNGQIQNAMNIPVNVTTGIDETTPSVFVSVYPNPVADLVNVSASLTGARDIVLSITDAAGRVFLTESRGTMPAGSHLFRLDAAGLASGVYFLTVESGEERIVKKFVK